MGLQPFNVDPAKTFRTGRGAKFPAEVVVDRPAAPAAEHDRQAQRRPQQREFVAPIGPEIAAGPLKEDHDHDHLHEDHPCSEAGEQPDREEGGGGKFRYESEISEQQRERQSLGRNASASRAADP